MFTTHFPVRAIIFSFIFSLLFFSHSALAVTFTEEEKNELAAISLRLQALTRLFESLKKTLVATTYAQTATSTPLSAPTGVSSTFTQGEIAPPSPAGKYQYLISFNYGGNISDVQSFRLYFKKPGESSFSAVATFSNLSSLVVTSGCSQQSYSGVWSISNCTYWRILGELKEPSNFPAGQYSAYVVAVDAGGIEGPVSSTVDTTVIGQSNMLSPIGMQSTLTPTFRWSVPSDWLSTFSEYEYYLYINDSPSPVTNIGGALIYVLKGSTDASTVYTGPALSPTKTYYAHVWSKKGGYTSMGAATTFTVSSADTSPPTAPSGLTASAQYPTTVNLSWTASTDTTGVTGYKIFQNNTLFFTTTFATTTFAVSVSGGTTYSYYVKAIDAAGNESLASATVSVTTPTTSPSSNVPAAPSNLSAILNSNGVSVNFTWSDNSTNESGFTLYTRDSNLGWRRVTQSDFAANSTQMNITDYNVTAWFSDYKLVACNSYGCSADSNPASVTFTASTFAATPTNLTASVSGSNVILNWTDNANNETKYSVYQLASDGSVLAQVGFDLAANTTSWTHYSVVPGTYKYRVNACSSTGCSLSSNQPAITVSSSGSSSCTGLNLSFQNNKNSYVIGETATYTYTCTPGGTASYVEVQVVKPDSTVTTYNTASGSISTNTLGFSTSNLIAGNHTLRACFSAGCASVTASLPFTITTATSSGDASLIGHWKFDGNGNNEVSGKPNAVTVGSAVFNSSGGKLGGYLYIPTGSDWAKIPYNSVYDLPNTFTIEFWFRQRSDKSFLQNLVYKGTPINNYNFYIYRQLWNQYNFGPIIVGYTAVNTGYWSQSSNPNQLSHGSWHHVAYTRNSSEAVYYLDGVLTSSLDLTQNTEYSGAAKTPVSDIIIGDSAVDTDIDNLRIYNRALSQSEVLQNGGFPSTIPDTTAPSAVTNLNAYNPTANSLTLSWAATGDDGNTGTAAYYSIRYATSPITSESAWLTALSLTATPSTIPSPFSPGSYQTMTALGLNPSTAYYFAMKVYDEANNASLLSNSTYLTTLTTSTNGTVATSTATTTITTALPPPPPPVGTVLPPPPPPTVAPVIFTIDSSRTYPKQGEVAVDPNIRIKVAFTRAFDPASTFAQFFSLSSAPGSFVNGAFIMQGDSFEFIPSSALAPNTTYTYDVFTTLKDTNRVPLASPFRATFTTSGSATISGATVKGKVRDAEGKPISGANIHVFQENFTAHYGALSDSNGVFTLGLPPGKYGAEVFPSFGVERMNFTRPAPIFFSVSAGETKELTFEFRVPAKIITGSVKFADGTPVTDAGVGAYSRRTSQFTGVFTDAKGNFMLNVGSGEWIVGVRPQDPHTARWSWNGEFPEVRFSDNETSESKTVEFIVQSADATLTVQVVTDNGTPLSGIGLVVDTIKASGKENGGENGNKKESRIPPEFRRTDAAGKASFSLYPSTYYLRIFIAPGHGFINPEEQTVVLVSKESRTITLLLKKREIAKLPAIRGITKREDGTPVSAYVWGWSEKGRFLQTFSDELGGFVFSVSPDDSWHIGAGTLIENIPAKSSENIIDMKKTDISVELILVSKDEVSLPPSVSVSQNAVEQVVAQAQDGAKISLPPSSAAPSGVVSVEVKPTIEAPSQAGASVVSTVYDINIRDQKGEEVKTLDQEAEIVLPYDEKELAAKGVSEDEIVPSFFDETTASWVKIDSYTIDKDKNIIIARVKHLTRFAIVAAADIVPPDAPAKVGAIALGAGKIKLSWANPLKDFNHAKIYRSLAGGMLGEIRAAEVFTQEFTDEGVTNGIQYYYTVRAVDSAGNESGNKEYVNVVALGTSQKKPALALGSTPVKKQTGASLGFNRNLILGDSGDDVKRLQEFLRDNGFYPEGITSGYFGSLTAQAVIRFQDTYASEILMPAGLSRGTGYMGPSTRAKLNALIGGTLQPPTSLVLPAFLPQTAGVRDLAQGITGEDVKTLQQFLFDEGVYPEGRITGYFGELTKKAVIRFQEKYASEILTPAGFSRGTGYVGPSTKKKIEALLLKK